MANALILHGLFAEFPAQFLQGILEPNLIPSREFESRSREFGAPEIPTRRDFVGRLLIFTLRFRPSCLVMMIATEWSITFAGSNVILTIQITNLGVGSSNLSGRASFINGLLCNDRLRADF